MRLSRHVCGYIGREVGVLRYELYGLVTLIYRVQVDSHVREVGTGRTDLQLPSAKRTIASRTYSVRPGTPARPIRQSLESTQTTVCTVRYAHSLHSTDTASIADSLYQ